MKRFAIPFVLALFVAVVWVTQCPGPGPAPLPDAAIADAGIVDTGVTDAGVADAQPALDATTLAILNGTDGGTTVYVAFGAGSVVNSTNWATFCTANGNLNCSFPLLPGGAQALPLGGQNLNATFAFGGGVGCGMTKAEVNINTANNADTYDISLVDGWNVDLAVNVGGQLLGPTVGRAGNEKVFGVFPLGCDICVARQKPPCGFSPGSDGCKAGTQYNPAVPCQYQAPAGPLAATIMLGSISRGVAQP